MSKIILTDKTLPIFYQSMDTQVRVLKVTEIGDFWAKRTMPSIRLQGKWMLQAGIFPNHHVQITNPCPGVLLIQLLDDFTQAELQPTNPNPFEK
jgi:hypothetical protein